MTFGLVGVQQCFRRPAADLCGQFPAEVECVLNAQVEALSAGGWMDVRRIAGQQHPPDPIALGQPGGIPEAGHPARGVHAEIGSGDGAQLLFEILEGGRFRAVADSRGGDDDADRPLRRRAGARIACWSRGFRSPWRRSPPAAHPLPSRPSACRSVRARRGSRRRAVCAPCCARRHSRRDSANAAVPRRPARRSRPRRPARNRRPHNRAGPAHPVRSHVLRADDR